MTYDGNGNIQTYGRNGASPTTAQTIDSLTYHYTLTNGKISANKLNYITDAISSSGYNLDLRNQTNTTNYRYDALGNLIYDAYSGITGNGGLNSITWSVYNKPLKIYKAGADSITYLYNTANRRVSKNELGITTWYVRDAQGNVLGLYDNIHGTINWREQDLYGSSRLGMWMPNMNIALNNSVAIWDTVERKQYELDNYRSNVMTTVTDKRLQHSTNGTTIDYFVADAASAQDYYPFGMLMPVRNYTFGSDSTYRYGFNGKENDNSVKGSGNQQDYGDRLYDTRLGRFLSTDFVFKEYPELSTYQFASNTPIQSIDLDGREKYLYIYDFSNEKVWKTKIELQKAGPLGNGILILANKEGVLRYYYGSIIADKGITAFKKSYEGVHLDKDGNHVYYLDKNKHPTIGYGHLIQKGEPYKPGSKITEVQAQALFRIDTKRTLDGANNYLNKYTLTEVQKNSLYDLAFNGGPGFLTNFDNVSSDNNGENYFWRYMGGGPGLQKRRFGENLLYSEGKYFHIDFLNPKKQKADVNAATQVVNNETDVPILPLTGNDQTAQIPDKPLKR